MQVNTETIFLTRGVPAVEALPDEWLAGCMQAVLQSDGATVLQYGNIGGYPPLRKMLAEDFKVSPEEVLVGNGSLHLQDLLAACLIKPGDTVLVEQPSYDRAIKTFRRRGARVIGIPLEQDGLNLEKLEAELRRQVPAFLYLIPDFQNPTGITTSEPKRREILSLAEKYGFWVIEDVPYRLLRYRESTPPPLLREINPTRVITISSYSKLISPAMRVGYMVGPAELVAKVTRLAEDTILTPVLVSQAAVAEFRRRGLLETNIERLKALYTPRLEAMLDALQRYLPQVTPLSRPEGGFFVSIMLPPEANYSNLFNRAKEAGLMLTEGSTFFAEWADDGNQDSTQASRFVRLPFPAIEPAQIEEGVRRLAGLI
ncbi:MAG TPA: PLP-dependent aminotransferase family protein [Chloroflexia bacterium]|nr:PLP-dependent aminotransferase family protein [Chloroflexia bacterium]